MKTKKSTELLIKDFITDLNTLPLDFQMSHWAEIAIKIGSENFYNFGRKGTAEKYAEAIYKALIAHPEPTVNGEFSANYISSRILKNVYAFDAYRIYK